uniref:Uncharacterized protein n=1 Tax=Candidatus Nitrotoga fabula TaxID=2182327 RepID=A0A2X0SID5_9PROT|nr:protein of unknown function [Candidatus Nitrotoga fabula]
MAQQHQKARPNENANRAFAANHVLNGISQFSFMLRKHQSYTFYYSISIRKMTMAPDLFEFTL